MAGSQTYHSSRHVMREAVDADGNPFLVDAIVNNKEGTIALRIISLDGNVDVDKLHTYIGYRPLDSVSVKKECDELGFTVEGNNLMIESFDTNNLRYIRLLRRLETPKTTKTSDGKFVTTWLCEKCGLSLGGKTLIQGYPITIESIPCLTKELSIKACESRFDNEFAKCAVLYETDKEVKKAVASVKW